MLNSKSFHVIDKDSITGNIHVVGVGALGSQVVERLVRLNLASRIIVYDMDEVEEKNLNNQAYLYEHIGMSKVDAMINLASKIDPHEPLRAKKKQVSQLMTTDSDIVILAIDNFESRASILNNIVGNPLVLSGGISSIGGNFEIVRGRDNYVKLASEYSGLESGQEYDENDLTPCGSPISIYHRIGIAAGLMADAVIKYRDNVDPINLNIVFDTPNLTFIKQQ